MSNVSMKVTVEYLCENMISEEDLNSIYKGDIEACYAFISDDFQDSPENFASKFKIAKIERANDLL